MSLSGIEMPVNFEENFMHNIVFKKKAHHYSAEVLRLIFKNIR